MRFLLATVLSFLVIAAAQANEDAESEFASNSSYPYQCQVIRIPANQIPYTLCNYQFYLQPYIGPIPGPGPGPRFYWSDQIAYGINHEIRACDMARNFAWQTCQQATWQWYSGRATCFDQFYRCTSYIPAGQ
ncbi:MAG: hypothetical protein QE271_05840 [Bacteriovoracaceae bacterium]|nr:hypothetical protein [Bacteriovoracaceae bacterium]